MMEFLGDWLDVIFVVVILTLVGGGSVRRRPSE
jgi:hypothetical protein